MSLFNQGTGLSMFWMLSGCLLPSLVHARGFLIHRASSIRNGTGSRALDAELSDATAEALGCGGRVDEGELSLIEQRLAPVWRTLPKTRAGNVERHSLRYAVHRYFNRASSLHIRGFEPSRPPNASGWGEDDILAQRVPAFVESVLESQHKLVRGFTLGDAAHVIATIEQLILDGESALLEEVYMDLSIPSIKSLNHQDLSILLESYMIRWLLRVDSDEAARLMSDPMELMDWVPQWNEVKAFLFGRIRGLEDLRRRDPTSAMGRTTSRKGHNAFSSRYSFQDVHRIVGGITASFAAFWDSECASMKASLFDMDTHRTGRVPLSKFYSNGLEADWRFGESEAYLRELGALDETNWRGKQVIISNYMQAASNCAVSTGHYLVCCSNDCEAILDDIELAFGSPSASPEKLYAVVSNVSSQSTLDDDFAPALDEPFLKQLELIAAVHGGEVPLHGRLFAQWLHYVFPRECAFPHKAGVATSITPSEYGDNFYASAEEMQRHVNTSHFQQAVQREDLQWMSQWTAEDELIAEQSLGLKAPWEQENYYTLPGLAMVVVLAGLLGLGSARRTSPSSTAGLPFTSKGHLV